MPESNERSRVLTLVFTDLADSTALKTARGDGAVGDLISRHREHVTSLAEECSGRVIDWAGDGCFLTFETATAGVLFSLRLQNVHAEETDLPGVRIGVHLGEITEKPGPDNTVRIEGLAVDVAARISGLAKPGQVLMSSAVYNSARQRMGVEAMGMPLLWQLHGTYALKGFDTPLDIAEAGLQGLTALEAPKAGDKAQLVKRAKKQPQQFKQSSARGVPLWAVGAIVIVLAIVIGSLLLRGTPATQPALSTDAPIESLAVLPFENISGDPEQEYFVDGMTEALTAELAKIGALKVTSRTSTMQYKGTERPLPEIADELGVDVLVEGSVFRSGNEVRITAQLVHGGSDAHLWAESYNGTLDNVITLQSEVALAIASAIQVAVTPEDEARIAKRFITSPEAYDEYLKGMGRFRLRTENDMMAAIEHFEHVVALDPNFAPAFAGLADVYNLLPTYHWAEPDPSFAKAREFTDRAIELDPESVEGITSRAWYNHVYALDAIQSEQDFRRAIELDPNYVIARSWYAIMLQQAGRLDEARAQLDIALEIDPNDLIARMIRGIWHYSSRDAEEATRWFEGVLQASPNHVASLFLSVEASSWAGKHEEALAYAQRILAVDELNPSYQAIMAFALAQLGREAQARAMLSEIQTLPPDTHVSPYWLARLHFELDQLDEGFELLALALGDVMGLSALRTAPGRDPLRDDKRYWDILASIGFPPLPPSHPGYAEEQAWLTRRAAEEVVAKQPKPVRRFAMNLSPDLPILPADAFSMTRSIAVSPTGSHLAYVSGVPGSGFGLSTQRIAVRAVGSTTPVPLEGTERGTGPFFSPDGKWIGFADRGKLKRVSVEGGPVELLAETLMGIQRGSWGDDGFIYFADEYAAYRVPESGGTPETIVEPGNTIGFGRSIQPLPGGDALLLAHLQSEGAGSSIADIVTLYEIVVLSPTTGQRIQIAPRGVMPQYISSGHIVYADMGVLFAVPFDADRLEVTGPKFAVHEPRLTRPDTYPQQWTVDADGSLYFAPTSHTERSERSVVWVDRDGTESPIPLRASNYEMLDLAPDGNRFVYSLDDNSDIWIYDLRSHANSRLTFDAATDMWPIWTPDGEHVVFHSSRENATGIFEKRADGMGTARRLTTGQVYQIPGVVSAERDRLISLDPLQGSQGRKIFSVSYSEPGEPEPLWPASLDTPTGYFSPSVSPDGNWLAYTELDEGVMEVYVTSFPNLDGKWQVSDRGGSTPVWNPEGGELFYWSGESVEAVAVDTTSGFATGERQSLFAGPYMPVFDTSVDGQRFLMIKSSSMNELVVVQNWTERLKRNTSASSN